jgi:hypothetical protein
MYKEDAKPIKGFRLFQEIIDRSEADTWEEAKDEWFLQYIEMAGEGEDYSCLCTHPHIKELCYIKNKINGNEVLVGNCCVKKFMELESDLIFQAIRRGKVNSAMLEYAFSHNMISEWENKFMLDVMRKRKMTFKQRAVYDRVSDKILSGVRE